MIDWKRQVIICFAAALLSANALRALRSFFKPAARDIWVISLTAVSAIADLTFLSCLAVPFLAEAGVFNYASSSFQWPVCHATNVGKTSDKLSVVGISHIGRIQIYGSDGTFVRGWQVSDDHFFKDMKLRVENDDTISVFTTRQDSHLVFNVSGRLLSDGPIVPALPPNRIAWSSGLRTATGVLDLACPWYFVPFTEPSYLPAIFAVSAMLHMLLQRRERALERLSPETAAVPS